ncbi:hypothetical protein Tco_0519126 [Tanacetum coccineum]
MRNKVTPSDTCSVQAPSGGVTQVSSEDEAAMEIETKDTSVPKSPSSSARTIHIKELTTWVSLLQSQTIKLEEEKPVDEAKAAN